jgi:hypothetical protein
VEKDERKEEKRREEKRGFLLLVNNEGGGGEIWEEDRELRGKLTVLCKCQEKARYCFFSRFLLLSFFLQWSWICM